MILVLGMAALPQATAAPMTPEAALIRVLTAPQIQAGWFAPTFLAQASLAQVQQARANLVAVLGAYTAVTAEGNSTFVVRFQHGTATAQIQLDNAGRIDALVFTDVQSATVHPPRTKLTAHAALDRVLSSAVPLAAWFAPTFVAQVSLAQLRQTIAGVRDALGPYLSVAVKTDGTFQALYGLGALNGKVHIDQQGRIDGLLITGVVYNHVSRSAAVNGLRQLPGMASLLVLANNTPVLALDPDRSLAVGSAFKLAVLAAVQQEVAAHTLSWTQPITLQAHDMSLGSGILQSKPAGSTYTIEDLTRYMISISDNTAANMLIRVAGRKTIDALIPVADQPLLTTRELFALKEPAHAVLRTRYLAAKTPEARMRLLPAIDALPLPSVSTFTGEPMALQVEYYFTTRQLCGLLRRVAALPQMSVNPGVATVADWEHVAYKGGSEAGVLNLTTQVTAFNGTSYCVAATWNNPDDALDDAVFELYYANVLSSYRTAG
jgi:beta-lactamase class A